MNNTILLKQNRNLKVLYLARWYPNRYDPMFGLFIKRHAEAANNCCDVGVVYVHQTEDGLPGNKVYDIDFGVVNGVPTAKIYYPSSKIKLFPVNKLINVFRFFKANFIGAGLIKKHLGGYNLVHVHVLTRLGLIAMHYKLFHGKPYLISEHWSRYLDLTGSFNGFLRKAVTKLIVKHASFVTTVTENLANAMQSHGLHNDDYVVLPNVVDNVFLENAKKADNGNELSVFVHVSCFEDRSKNISGLLRVIGKLSGLRDDFIFRLIGDGKDMDLLRNYAKKLQLTDEHVVFTGLLEGEELVAEMASANMLVVFSNYENLPVVINESLSLGVPVIATRVGGIPERINKDNGVLLDAGDEGRLLDSLIDFLDGRLSFNMDEIQASAREGFSPKTVGNVLCGLYSRAVLDLPS